MRSILRSMLVLLLSAGLVLTGCNEGNDKDNEGQSQAQQQQTKQQNKQGQQQIGQKQQQNKQQQRFLTEFANDQGDLGRNSKGQELSLQKDARPLGTGSIRIFNAGPKPKNVIVMVGDGMGIGQMEIARLMEHGKDGELFLQTLPNLALSMTYSANNRVTDSAAAATALATGYKTNNEMIGVTPDGFEVDSILDLFQLNGKKVGVISTNTATDATPAGFTASVSNRWTGQEEVARQQLQSRIDVILGGGASYFGPKKQNGNDLVQAFRDQGYAVATTRDELTAANGDKLLGLFAPSYMNYKLDREELKSTEPTLTEMTSKAIEVLSRGNQGFFLMSEGARIDHAAHAADITGVWRETIEFDEAVEYAVDWAKKDGQTLVVVLADHETMGLAASEPMDIAGLKEIDVSPEYMAAQLKQDDEGNFTAESVRNVFKTYANIDVTDAQIEAFNRRARDTEGKVYASYRVAWEIGSMIADKYLGGALSPDVRMQSSTGGHTANWAPVFSFGPGAENFEGVLDNTDIPKLIAQIMGYRSDRIHVSVNGQRVLLPVPAFMANNTTLVPIREISEALGVDVKWDNVMKRATLTKGDLNVQLSVGQKTAKKNNADIALTEPLTITREKIFVPLRFVGEAFGADVKWDQTTRNVVITMEEAPAGGNAGASPTPAPSPSPSPSPSPTPVVSPAPSPTATPEATPTATPTATPAG